MSLRGQVTVKDEGAGESATFNAGEKGSTDVTRTVAGDVGTHIEFDTVGPGEKIVGIDAVTIVRQPTFVISVGSMRFHDCMVIIISGLGV